MSCLALALAIAIWVAGMAVAIALHRQEMRRLSALIAQPSRKHAPPLPMRPPAPPP